MEWIRENWIFILIFIFFIAMHSFGGGCMGGHGRHSEEGHHHKEHTGEEAEKRERKGGHGCC